MIDWDKEVKLMEIEEKNKIVNKRRSFNVASFCKYIKLKHGLIYIDVKNPFPNQEVMGKIYLDYAFNIPSYKPYNGAKLFGFIKFGSPQFIIYAQFFMGRIEHAYISIGNKMEVRCRNWKELIIEIEEELQR